MNLSVREVFDKVSKLEKLEDKVATLRQYGDQGVKQILYSAFDPNYKWDLPEGMPPTKIDRTIPDGYAHNNLRGQARLLYIFDQKYQKVKRMKKEMLFIDFLEGLYYKDAELMVAIKDGQLPTLYPGLSEDVVRLAFPGLLTEPKRPEEILDPR